MFIMRILSIPASAMLCGLFLANGALGADVAYPSPEVVGVALRILADESPGSARVLSLVHTPGGRLSLIHI